MANKSTIYHQSPDGIMRICRATKRPCPYGPQKHFVLEGETFVPIAMYTPPQEVEPKKQTGKERRVEHAKFKDSAFKTIDSYLKDGEKLLDLFKYSGKFKLFSTMNNILLKEQLPNAIHLGEYHYWQERGANVQKGESGSRILREVSTKVFKDENGIEKPVTQASFEEITSIMNGAIEAYDKKDLRIGYVWDITQTNTEGVGGRNIGPLTLEDRFVPECMPILRHYIRQSLYPEIDSSTSNPEAAILAKQSLVGIIAASSGFELSKKEKQQYQKTLEKYTSSVKQRAVNFYNKRDDEFKKNTPKNEYINKYVREQLLNVIDKSHQIFFNNLDMLKKITTNTL